MEWINLLMVVLGGGVVKLLDVILGHSSNKKKNDLDEKKNEISERDIYSKMASKIRDELREEQARLSGEIRAMQEDLDKWKEKYYSILERYAQEKAVNASLKKELERLTEQVEELNELKEVVQAIEERLGIPIHELTEDQINP